MSTVASKELFKRLVKALLSVYDDREATAIAKNYLMDRFHLDTIRLTMNTEIAYDQTWFEHDLRRLSLGIPYQHVVGFSYFFGLKFITNKHALIPRPETEELVQWVIDEHKDKGQNILDIGTGTGCIPIALQANIAGCTCVGIDVSEEALNLARTNADKNHVHISFKKCDILKEELPQGEFDIIVSNPPYIPEADRALMHQNVLDHEPGLALFVEDYDPLLFYRTIARKAKNHLTANGHIYFEIHEAFGSEIAQLLENEGYKNIIVKKDLQEKDRMIRAILKK